MSERLHRPGAVKALHRDDGVEQRHRQHTIGCRVGDVESDRSTDVVDDQVKAADTQRIDRRAQPTSQTAPGVVGVAGAFGKAETGQIDRNPPQTTLGQGRHDLAVEE